MLALIVNAAADSLSLTAVADTTIFEGSIARDPAGQAMSSATTMIVGQINSGDTCRGLVRFNLDALPTNAVITAASLQISVSKAHLPTADTLAIYRLTSAWLESVATWDTSGLADWTGGAFAAAADSSALADGLGPLTFASTPALISTVENWRTNAASNNGWIIRNNDESSSSNARRILTHESASGRPTLTIQYTAPPPPLTLLNPRVQEGQFAFDFMARAGSSYTVQYKTSLNQTNWTTFQQIVDPGADMLTTVVDDFAAPRYFRVITP